MKGSPVSLPEAWLGRPWRWTSHDIPIFHQPIAGKPPLPPTVAHCRLQFFLQLFLLLLPLCSLKQEFLAKSCCFDSDFLHRIHGFLASWQAASCPPSINELGYCLMVTMKWRHVHAQAKAGCLPRMCHSFCCCRGLCCCNPCNETPATAPKRGNLNHWDCRVCSECWGVGT